VFPARYLKQQIPKVTLDIPTDRGSVISDITPRSAKSNPQSGGTRSSLPDGRERAVAKNKITDRWKPYFEKGHTTRNVKKYCSDNNISLPYKKARSCYYCLSWHTRGQCNTACGSAADHVDHTPVEANELEAWCKEHYKTKAE
jgi:hypothetical protein